MRIAIIGAGFSGLVTAKTLTEYGHEVVVFERAPDVGGVWSATRRYPGVKTQNSKQTYCLSTLPMPKHYPKHPQGEQVQAYLEAYVELHQLQDKLRLNTEVIAAEQVPEGWRMKTRIADGTESSDNFEYLVVCSGCFSKPFVPSFPGAEEFKEKGGRICHSCEIHTLGEVSGKDVLVVGYGKSACDSALAISETAASTTVIARRLIWKMPSYVGGALHYSYLLLNRFGESLFQYIRPWKSQSFFAGSIGSPIRNLAFSSLEMATRFQCSLKSLALVPPGPYSDIARSTISLVTPGFYTRVAEGRIQVKRDTYIKSLSPGSAHLSDGSTVSADVVVCGTGFVQLVEWLGKDVDAKIRDEKGNWRLYRHVLPVGVPRLAFNGFNSSLFCPLTSEVAALWIAQLLEEEISLPSDEEQIKDAETTLAWMDERSSGKHAHGTNLVPFSLSNIDDYMSDLDITIPSLSYVKEWLLPVDPTAYKGLSAKLRARNAQKGKIE